MTESRLNAELRRGIVRWFIRNTIIVLIAAACLFATSRDPNWGMAWAYLGVLLASKVAIALILGRSNPELLAERGGTPEDVKAVGPDVLRHRLVLTYEADAEEVTSEQIVKRVFEVVEVP